MSGIAPTDEQQDCIDLFGTGDSLSISALAGTGKTTALAMMADANPHRRIRYVAFSKALSVDAKDAMPAENTEVSTLHSMAFKVTGTPFAARLGGGRMKAWQIARALGIQAIDINTDAGRKILNPDYLAGIVMKGVDRFCGSADPEPTARHMPYIEGLDLPDAGGRRTYRNNDAVREHLAPALRAAWRDQCDPTGSKTRYQHGAYLKNFQLEQRQIEADALFVDEAQDLQPVSVEIARQQHSSQLVLVGDRFQSVFEFLGSVDAMVEIQAVNTGVLTGSFRFGAGIADAANQILALLGSDLRLTGLGPTDSRVGRIEGHPQSVLCRTNATAVRQLLEFQQQGLAVHLVGGGADIAAFARGAEELMTVRSTRHPELACFNSWGEVRAYVASDPSGDDLRLLVSLVDEFTVPTILRALDSGVSMGRAQVIVCTGHKSKGLTFATTALAGDFPDETTDPAELRLLYVASTRPRHVLDITRCGAMAKITGQIHEPPGAPPPLYAAPPAPQPMGRPVSAPVSDFVSATAQPLDPTSPARLFDDVEP